MMKIKPTTLGTFLALASNAHAAIYVGWLTQVGDWDQVDAERGICISYHCKF
jgi:hypothetical protein